MLREHMFIGAEFDLDTTGDKIVFSLPEKFQVSRLGLVVTGADTGGGVVKFDRRVLAGSDSGRGDGDVGAITISAANNQGKILYEIPATAMILNAGDQIVVEATTDTGTGCNLVPFVKGFWISEHPASNTEFSAV
jgi:hypothetical protein